MQAHIIINELTKAVNALEDSQIEALIAKLLSHKRIFVYGTGRSGLMLKAFAMRLMQIGLNAFVVGETTTPSVTKGDLLIVASASGETDSVNLMAQAALKQGADLVIITATLQSTLSGLQSPDIIIASSTKYNQSAVSIQPLGSLFEQMLLVLFDTVILTISHQTSASYDNMAHRHASLE